MSSKRKQSDSKSRTAETSDVHARDGEGNAGDSGPAEVRSDWEQNHARIRDAMLQLIDEKRGKFPSQFEIAERTGLSRGTVQRHMRNMELSRIAKPFRMLADTVLLGLANKAVKGDTSAAKLYFKLTFGSDADRDAEGEDQNGSH